MDRSRRLPVRFPGLSFIAAAALTVLVEAVIGIGASISVASGLPSVTPPKLPKVGSTVSSATSTASSTVSNAAGTASGAVNNVSNTAPSTTQKLVSTASNLSSTATSTAGSAGQAVTSAAAGTTAPVSTPATAAPATSTPTAAPPAATTASSAGSSTSSSGAQAASAGQPGSGARHRASRSGGASQAARHQWYVRRLVTHLSGCVAALPEQSQEVLVLAAGIGSAQPSSPRQVARALDISVAREQRIENSAVVALRQTARHEGCQSSSVVAPLTAVGLGLQPGLSLIKGPQAGGAAFLPAAQALGASSKPRHRSAVRAMHIRRHHHPAVGSSGSSRVERSAIGSPSAAGSVSAWIFVLLGLLLGAGFLVMGRQRLRARPEGSAPGTGLAATGAAGAAAAHAAEQPAPPPDSVGGGNAAASWDPPGVIAPTAAAMAADAPAPLAPDSPAPLEPDSPGSPTADVFVPEGFAPSAPEAPGTTAADFTPAGQGAPTPAPISEAPASPVSETASPTVQPVRTPVAVGRPRVQAGRNWLRRHRQAAAMVSAVAGAALAMMVSTAGRSARLIFRRRRRRG